MNCVIYVRVSTDKQAEKDLSLPAQLAACRQYASQRGWQVIEEFTEAGLSARTADRPKLKRLLKVCRRRRGIDVVLVHKIDRLARSVTDYAAIRVLLKRRGIRVVSVQEQFEDSISGQLVENIMAAIAEFYSANLGEEVKKGMRQKLEQGGWPHHVPRGYRWITTPEGKRGIQVVPEDAVLIRRVFERYASGDVTVRTLVQEMATEGLRTSGGHPLSPAHLRRMLGNAFYAGRIKWRHVDTNGQHEPIVSIELFERVQVSLAERHRPISRTRIVGFPLRGLAQCASCGGRMTAERHKGRFGYYRCCRQQYRRSLCDARYCNADRVHVDLRRICQGLGLQQELSIDDPKTKGMLQSMFESIALGPEGIVRYEVRRRVTLNRAA